MRIPVSSAPQPARLAILVPALAAALLAQMGGMRGGTPGGGMGNSLGGMMGGALSGMMGGSGLTFGPDGTLYLVRSNAPAQGQSPQAATTQLAAIDANGNAKWTLAINSPSASQPALGKDGTLFVTTATWGSWMYGWMYNRSTPSAADAPTLLVIKPGATSAAITTTVRLTGQLASAPQISADNAGGYAVNVVTIDAFPGNGGAGTGSYLYAFTPTGTQKYRLQLSQGGSGMMGF